MLRLVAKKMQENTKFYINQIKYSEKRILILFSIFIQFSCAFLETKRREGREKKERKKERKSIFIQFSCAFLGTKRREGRDKKERKKERKKKYLQGIAHL